MLPTLLLLYISSAALICSRSDFLLASREFLFKVPYEVTATAAKRPIMVATTRISINVKPEGLVFFIKNYCKFVTVKVPLEVNVWIVLVEVFVIVPPVALKVPPVR